MKKVILLSTLAAALSVSALAHAENSHSVSVGYAYGKLEDIKMKGVNVKYRYEWESPISVVGSFTYMSANQTEFERDWVINTDAKNYSLSVGPAYRFNDYVSIYGLLGINNFKYHSTLGTKNSEGINLEGRSTSTSLANTSFGVQVNPIKNMVIDIAYTWAKTSVLDENYNINGFNIGIGYRF